MLGAPGRAGTAHIVQFGAVGMDDIADQLTPETGDGGSDYGEGAR
jgi:hypothetical protein